MGSVSVTVKVLDVNDNAPEFARFYEAFVCENAKAGQVRNASNTRSWGGDAVLQGDSVPERVNVGKRVQLTTRFFWTLVSSCLCCFPKASTGTGIVYSTSFFSRSSFQAHCTIHFMAEINPSLGQVPAGKHPICPVAATKCYERCHGVSPAHVWQTRLTVKRQLALSTPGLMGAGHNILHQLQRGAKLNLFCCELEMTESHRQHRTSRSAHCKPAPPSKRWSVFAPLPSKTPSKPLNKVCLCHRWTWALPRWSWCKRYCWSLVGRWPGASPPRLHGGDLCLLMQRWLA